MSELLDLSFFDKDYEAAIEATDYIDNLKDSIKEKIGRALDAIIGKLNDFIKWLIEKKNNFSSWYSNKKADVAAKFGDEVVYDYKGLYQFATSTDTKNNLTIIETNLDTMCKNTEALTKLGVVAFKINASFINTGDENIENNKLKINMEYEKAKTMVVSYTEQITSEIDNRINGKIHEPLRKLSKKTIPKELHRAFEGHLNIAKNLNSNMILMQQCFKKSHKMAKVFRKGQLNMIVECISYTNSYVNTVTKLINLSDVIFRLDKEQKEAEQEEKDMDDMNDIKLW